MSPHLFRTQSRHRPNRAPALVLALFALLSAVPSSSSAAERMLFPAKDNVTNELVRLINAETVRIDISAWYLTEHAISIAVLNRHLAGVPVRLIGDRGSIFEIDANTRNEFYFLANGGVPIRLRVNPTWYPEIVHWKMGIFVGQNTVEFGSANWVTSQLAPDAPNNYSDETAFFTDDPSLVKAFKTKFDRMWNDTTTEPDSIAGGPPYMADWRDACLNEPQGCDFYDRYPNPAAMTVNRARLEPDNAMPADLVWGQGPAFNNRLVQEINAESQLIQFVIYRLTVPDITDALIARWQAGVPVQLLVEPSEYLNSKWPEFWLTHAYLDKLWAAGVPIKSRAHTGITHMKTLVTSKYATNASSNYAAAWQRDHNYFISASAKPTIYTAVKNRVTEMWNDPSAFAPFQPQAPAAPSQSSPGSSATGVSTSTSLIWNRATFATDYDVYMGFSSSALSRVANVQAQLVNDPPSTYSWKPAAALCAGTTYFWKVVSRTNATPVNPSISASSPTRSFTTNGTSTGCSGLPGSGGTGGGTGGGTTSNVPAPWTTADIGPVGVAGSATLASGVFTVDGAGADIWGASDAFRYVFQPMSGDGEVIARVTGLQNTHTWAKAGIMLRATTATGSAHVILDVTPGGTIEFMKRASTGAETAVINYGSQGPPVWLKLTRSGTSVAAALSSNGSTWTTLGTTTTSLPTSVQAGLVVTSHDTSVLNRATFDNVAVSAGSTPPPPPPPPPSSASDIVIYGSDVPAAARRGTWTTLADATAAGGTALVTPDNGVAFTSNPLSAPSDYFDVTFDANAGTPYTLWLRLRALNNSKYNDAVWVQFSDALVNGSPVYRMNSSSGLLVNLATDSAATSLNGWGWQNTAYWLDQATTVTFPTTGPHTMRIQIREDGVQIDQIVLSAGPYLSTPPGAPTNDRTIVAKP